LELPRMLPAAGCSADLSRATIGVMATNLLCPDCGGKLGEVAPGETGCTCGLAPAETNSKSDTATIAPPAIIEKFCVVCGKDTIGHRRLKDSRGYICYPCAKAEQAAMKAGKVRCKLCRKLVKPDGLVPMGKMMVCKVCFANNEESMKFKKKISTEHYDRHEKRNLIILAALALALLLVVVIQHFRK